MRILFTLFALAASVFMASANDYTDVLEVNINGSISTQTTTTSLNKQTDGTYSFILKNFILTLEGQQMGVGTIDISNVVGVPNNGMTTFVANQIIQIKEGDIASPSGTWTGPLIGDVPVRLMAELRGDQLYAVINIDMRKTLGQFIAVTFGNGGYQIPNSGFEAFHEEGTIDEPNHWHSFASCTGDFASFVSGTPHTFVSSVIRPGSVGKQSVLLTSAKVFGITANGTLTTGRMVAGAITATDPGNHAELDMGKTAKDSNGDPFYSLMNGQPDSLAVWVKFKQGTPSTAYPYATVSASVTDGTYYQEPQDKAYNNVLGSAKYPSIVSKDYQWQRISVPFSYNNTSLQPRAIFVTLSTNAAPGQGSIDSLYVDDLGLIYNQDISVSEMKIKDQPLVLADTMTYVNNTSLPVNVDDISVNTNSAKIVTTMEQTTNGGIAHVTVASQDLKIFKTYTINISGAVTNIGVPLDSAATAMSIYNLQGQRMDSMHSGQVYIVRQGNRTIKVIGR